MARRIGNVGDDHGGDLVGTAADVGHADAVVGAHDRDRFGLLHAPRAVHVVHTFQLDGLRRVDLDDHLFGVLRQHVGTAHRRGGDNVALVVDADRFDDGYVDFAEVAVFDPEGHLAEVHVHIGEAVVVGQLAHALVGLIGITPFDHAGARQPPVEFVADGRAGDQLDADLLAAFGAAGQRHGHGLGVPGHGEAARADGHAVLDQFGGLRRRHGLGLGLVIADAVVHVSSFLSARRRSTRKKFFRHSMPKERTPPGPRSKKKV